MMITLLSESEVSEFDCIIADFGREGHHLGKVYSLWQAI